MNKDELKLFIDGQLVNQHKLEDDHISIFLNNGLIKPIGDGTYKSNFVGLFCTPTLVVFSLPYGASKETIDSLSFENLRMFLINIVKSIRRFESHYKGDKEIILSGRMEAAIHLLEEYEEYGFLKLYEKKNSSQASGKTNWNRTIKAFTPIKQGNTWVYNSYIKRKNVSHQSHDFIMLQKWALKYALEKTYFVTDEFNVSEELLETNLTLNEAKELFLKLRNSSTKDREIYILELIGSLINEDDKLSSYAIYTKHFKVIWEKALQQTLAHNSNLVNLVPHVDWRDDKAVLNNLNLKVAGSKGKPEVDIIFQENNKLYILDAKYYDLRNRRPGLTDLYKQLFYGVAFKSLLNLEHLPENGFIFPILSNNNSEVFYKFSIVEYKLQEADKDLANIPAYFANVNTVLKSFVEYKELRTEYLKFQ